MTARIDDIGHWLLFLDRLARGLLSHGWPVMLIPGGLLALAFAFWLWRRGR